MGKAFRAWCERHYEACVADYARMRGCVRRLNNRPSARRSCNDCRGEPGFRRCWWAWIPGIAYFVYRLFIRAGGRRRWAAATLMAFFIGGFAQTIVAAPLAGCWTFSVITAFTCFALPLPADYRAVSACP